LLLEREENGKKKSSLAQQKLREEIGLDKPSFETLVRKVLHKMILEENLRPDGRKMDELRKITCKAGIFPRTHGSALFSRGLTHVVSIVTLGAPGDQLLLEGMEITGTKRFLHHYNFPPYSTGEVKPIRAPGRREIGHGALVEKALRFAIPETESFPYTIRVVSECLSSNGSTSMASVCASSLALFDAGVPLKRSVAGISCGLIIEDDNSKPISDRNYKILTDIQGPEDSLGDMDFKIAGTQTGVTALQLDVKIRGLTLQIIKDTLCSARKAREKILEKMENVLPHPRPQVSPFAPQILSIKINPEKIREVIGPGGTMINKIIEETDTSIDIENNGLIFVTAKDKEKAKQAINWIKGITREIKTGEVFQGRIEKIMNFGLLVEILPNQIGLLHISEIFPKKAPRRRLSQRFKIGQIIPVKVKNIDQSGRITLSLVKERPH
ncbi:polyribonucleotide nucleotidyltransferase, partial [bacterium]|nr:polyribonucleotide nucleotidyltransferase [bacterium]